MRLLAFSACTLCLSSMWLVHAVHAHVDELIDRIDSGALRYAHARFSGTTHIARLNGLELRVTSGTTDDSVTSVLDFFHSRCRDRVAKLNPALVDGVLRDETDTRGHVACFDADGRSMSATTLLDRLQAFARTGDASELGVFRYVTAERTDHGTAYLTVASEGKMPLTSAFPARAEAPGSDPIDIPRPQHATRALALSFADIPGSMHVYRSSDSDARSVYETYRLALLRAGFHIIAGPAAHERTDANRMLEARKLGVVYDVSVTTDEQKRVVVSLLRAP